MVLLRRPVARSTTAAVLPLRSTTQRDRVADLRPRLDRRARPGHRCRRPPAPVEPACAARSATRASRSRTPWPRIPEPRRPPAAGGDHAGGRASRCRSPPAPCCWPGSPDHPTDATSDPVHVVWETLRLTPPTWITARITTREVDLGGTSVSRRARSCWSVPSSSAGSRELVPGDPDGPARVRPRPMAGRDARVRAPGSRSAPARTRARAAHLGHGPARRTLPGGG